ncbi:MAG: nucleotidyltransferase family protein [Ardenticatenales bacterium]|nr:nucleotidyltransferase family protein [Ardenticatenales bacterium]
MSVQSKTDIQSLIQQHSPELRALGVKRLGLFGSFVQNRAHEESDVDLLVEFETGEKSYDNFIHLVWLLEELFARDVEVVTPESLSPYLGPHILREVEDVPLHG